MHITEFTLKQHTPIIHFQADDIGATLRASEVKPKLDRFIINETPKYWKDISNKFSHEIDLIKKAVDEQKASLYSMSIKTQDNNQNKWYYFDNTKPRSDNYDNEVRDIKDNLQRTFGLQNIEIIFQTPLFSNRDKIKDKKWEEVILGVKNFSDIKLKIKTKHEKILKLLTEVMPIFLTFENFGNRQNKGFGSFHIKGFSSNELKSILKTKYKVLKYKMFVGHQPFNEIHSIYKLMKNDPNKLGKLKLKNYYLHNTKKEQYYWEQETAAKFAATNILKLEEDERYVRAILGLANLYDYPQNNPKKQLNISDVDNEIERFQSPLTFKVVDNFIYLFCDNADDILNKTFRFEDSKTKKYFDIKTPDYFNPIDFLNQLKEWKTL